MTDQTGYWGYHVTIDAAGADLSKISDSKNIDRFARDLVTRIEMVAYGDPHIVHFGNGNKAGYTLVQLISTSSITCHFVEDDGNNNGTGSYYFDCFSCKPFDIQEVIDTCREYFGNTTERVNYFTRQA